MKKKVFALLVGIANYPKEINPLNGCVHDTTEMDLLFKDIFPEDMFEYKSRILVDNKAKRDAVIEGFTHFDQAKDDDVCIFYYSGHGSKVKTNATFWIDGSDKLESIVCYDSRFPSGYDIVDKELAYLIWKATVNKPDIHFVTIMDCCFSGNNTRDITERIKLFDENENVKSVEEFIGYSEFENGVPKRGRYIALSASQSLEPSKEKIIDGKYRGVFTYCLIDTIRNEKKLTDYDSIMDMVISKTKSLVKQQIPVLEGFGIDKRSGLFGQHALSSGVQYLLSYNNGWKINKGSLHGMTQGSILRLESKQAVTVVSTTITESEVDVPGNLDVGQLYPVIPEKRFTTTLSFYVSIEDENVKDILDKALQMQQYEGVFITEDIRNADYVISNIGADLVLYNPDSKFPLFERVSVSDSSIFLSRLTHIAKWTSTVNLLNIDGLSLLSKIKITLEDVKAVDGPDDDKIPGTEIPEWETHVFKYTRTGTEKRNPWFRLAIQNNHNKPLCIAILYCSSDFGVTDQLLTNTFVDPGNCTWAQYKRDKGGIYKTVPIFIDNYYCNNGIKITTDYLVVLVSELAFQSDFFNLKGLPIDRKVKGIRPRSIEHTSRSSKIENPLWAVIKIPVTIDCNV